MSAYWLLMRMRMEMDQLQWFPKVICEASRKRLVFFGHDPDYNRYTCVSTDGEGYFHYTISSPRPLQPMLPRVTGPTRIPEHWRVGSGGNSGLVVLLDELK